MNRLVVELFSMSSLEYEEAVALAKYLANNGVVVQKHARWEKKTRDGAYWFQCSECYEDAPRDRYGHDYFSKYCPRCGSRMSIEGEGRDE